MAKTEFPPALREDDLPALHASANSASSAAQATYLQLVRWDLAALVAGSLATAISFGTAHARQWTAVLGALCLFTSLVLTAVIRSKDYGKHWYGGRAIAESIKTLAWRYACNAEPFDATLSPAQADERFIEQLRTMLDESEHLLLRLTGRRASGDQITEAMRHLRESPMEDRKHAYLRDRIQDQREWYSGRAELNERGEEQSFRLIMIAQAAAVVAALLLILFPSLPINPASVLSTAAAALLAWLQLKRHQELAQSYAVAAHELGLIAEQGRHVATEDAFSAFVGDAEAAISREHTLWIARRDVPLSRQRLRS